MSLRGLWAANGWLLRTFRPFTPGWFLFALLAAMPLTAQRTPELGAALAGVVRTTAGTPVASARVTVTAAARHDLHTAMTGVDGRFTVAGVEPGRYSFMVQLPERAPTVPSVANVGQASVVLIVSDQNTLTITSEPQAPAPRLRMPTQVQPRMRQTRLAARSCRASPSASCRSMAAISARCSCWPRAP